MNISLEPIAAALIGKWAQGSITWNFEGYTDKRSAPVTRNPPVLTLTG